MVWFFKGRQHTFWTKPIPELTLTPSSRLIKETIPKTSWFSQQVLWVQLQPSSLETTKLASSAIWTWISDLSSTTKVLCSTSWDSQSWTVVARGHLRQVRKWLTNCQRCKYLMTTASAQALTKSTLDARYAARIWKRRLASCLVGIYSIKSASRNGSANTINALCAVSSYLQMMLIMNVARLMLATRKAQKNRLILIIIIESES